MHNRKLLNFVAAIKKNEIKAGQKIDLRHERGHLNIGEMGILLLCKALMHPNCPEGLRINLRGNQISDIGAVYICDALLSGKCKRGLDIDLSKTGVSLDWRLKVINLLYNSRYFHAATALQNVGMFKRKPLQVPLNLPMQDLRADPVSSFDFN